MVTGKREMIPSCKKGWRVEMTYARLTKLTGTTAISLPLTWRGEIAVGIKYCSGIKQLEGNLESYYPKLILRP